MSKKNKFENIINNVESSAFNSNNNVDSSAVNTSNDVGSSASNNSNVEKPVFNNIANDNIANDNVVNSNNVGIKASNTNKAKMSIIVARRQKRK